MKTVRNDAGGLFGYLFICSSEEENAWEKGEGAGRKYREGGVYRVSDVMEFVGCFWGFSIVFLYLNEFVESSFEFFNRISQYF